MCWRHTRTFRSGGATGSWGVGLASLVGCCSLRANTKMVPDNTDINVQDRRGETLTPGDQSERAADRTLTQRILQAIVADESLSTTAKNVKIIMLNGVVTLRGPVHSLQEKRSIEATAQHIVGTNNVDNQLEIKGY